MNRKHNIKLITGVLIGVVFLYLAFRKVDFNEMISVLRSVDYSYVLLGVLVLMFSHYLRALRWRILLLPIKNIPSSSLFSALTIGYAVNTFVPAHLGEFIRAFVVGKKNNLSMSATFSTIVVERILDVFFLVSIMLCVVFIHPFPKWLLKSGYIMLIGAVALFIVLVLLRVYKTRAVNLIGMLLNPLPVKIKSKLLEMIEQFSCGFVPLKKKRQYTFILFYSAAIWGCYTIVYYFCLKAFHLTELYNLPWYASLIILVVTTISIVIPSSPGYVGTFHYLCRLSLMMFGVSAGAALSYATIAHAVNVLPVAIVGFMLASYEGISTSRVSEKDLTKSQQNWKY